HYAEIKDIVWVHKEALSLREAQTAAGEVAKLNAALLAAGRQYVLIGPGRWGSSDPSLGIPVETNHILGAKLIVELPCGERSVEPSQGSHFFHEISALNIGYVTLTEREQWRMRPQDAHFDGGADSQYLDWLWLSEQEPAEKGEFVRHIAMEQPLRVALGGHDGARLALV
ncbi:hypothetical protein IJT17_04085, partial [bacterium]|nr:hypothetical protein [bacterium]